MMAGSKELIYREDAVKALNETEDIKGFAYKRLHNELMDIPAVEPP